MKNLIYILLLTLTIKTHVVASDSTFLDIDGLEATITNGLVTITFNSNASVTYLLKDGRNLVENITARTFYIDWNAGGGKFIPFNLTVLQNTTEMVHIMYFQPFSHKRLQMEYHIAMFSNISGFYQWINAVNNGNETIKMSEFRLVYRLNNSLMPRMSNMVRKGISPSYLSERPTVQDTTWQMIDGSYWSKYDYMEYIRKTPWFGIYGGGTGVWIVSASREYHSGGPLKQDLLTQHESTMCHYLHSSHLGTLEFVGHPGWSKFFGPWLVLVNSGSDDEILKNVAEQAKIEESRWTYSWLDDQNYPLERGTLSGRVIGQPKAAVVLYDSFDEQFDLQSKGYLYDTETDENGYFNLTNIRPGDYVLLVYPLAGQGSENLITKNITIHKGSQTIENIELPEPTGILWYIGETNRRSDGFRYSDELRNFYWHTLPPANHTFYIGKSNPAKDWYYAQTYNGTWNIVFNDKPDGNSRTLRIAIAAASGSWIFKIQTAQLQVLVNSVVVGNFEYVNEGAIYRGALQSGKFYSEMITVPADHVLDGHNVVSLRVLIGEFMYDAISYQKKQ